MDKICSYLFFIFLFIGQYTYSQPIVLEVRLVDSDNSKGISDAHVFLANTSFGGVTDADGRLKIQIPEDVKEDLIISHISYSPLTLGYVDYASLPVGHIVELEPNGLEIEELVITEKKSGKWKRNFKRFQKAFLGDNKAAEKCTIVNPYVLRFENKGGTFTTTAVDALIITNGYLGYRLEYHLDYLKIDIDGSIQYLGNAQFFDEKDKYDAEAMVELRELTYRNSPKHFFQSLINNQLESDGYQIKEVAYSDEKFSVLNLPERNDVLMLTGQGYKVKFDQFLEIVNLKQKEVDYSQIKLQQGGLESQRFGSSAPSESSKINYATSHIYKISPAIELDPNGNVLNTKEIREYGYWARQKVAHQLPLEYGNSEKTLGTKVAVKKENQSIAQDGLSAKDKYTLLLSLLYEEDARIKNQTLNMLSDHWENGFVPALIDVLRFTREQWLTTAINDLISEKYGLEGTKSFYSWLQWIWEREWPEENYYYMLKSDIYKSIDPKFETYFKGRKNFSEIPLNEVVWGGVWQDGIPPLRDPKMMDGSAAEYLDDHNVVFGMYINGIPRAYPKRILAWHEFFVDDFGDERIAGVYCTLCGTVIAYDMTHESTYHDLGTSGFLYRSNKLMYDKKTQSLWSTIEGKPVMGPLVGRGIELSTHPVVTTTWGEWRATHPDTEVLSLDTGHDRDYSDGAAYNEYFSTDDLMFPVPHQSTDLNNKDEVFVIRSEGYKDQPIAISIKYLKKKKWHKDQIGDQKLVVLSSKEGAARAYEASNTEFKAFQKGKLIDQQNREWTPNEECLTSDDGRKLDRLPGHNIFWFAWYNAYPGGRLVK